MFENKVVWITGASSGIGEAVAYEMAAEGAKLILSARREDALEIVKANCLNNGSDDADIAILPLDVTDTKSLEEKVAEAHKLFGQIDVLFNNAGISQRSLCIDTSVDTYRHLFEVDVFGPIALTRYLLPYMQKADTGHFIVTASVAGKVGIGERTGYCAAKHAVMGFYDALRTEVAGDCISVTTVTPGFIRTAISENALKGDGSAFGEMDKNIKGGMDVTTCAKAIMKGLRKGKKEIAVGRGVEMHSLWIKRYFPGLMLKIAEKVTQKAINAK